MRMNWSGLIDANLDSSRQINGVQNGSRTRLMPRFASCVAVAACTLLMPSAKQFRSCKCWTILRRNSILLRPAVLLHLLDRRCRTEASLGTSAVPLFRKLLVRAIHFWSSRHWYDTFAAASTLNVNRSSGIGVLHCCSGMEESSGPQTFNPLDNMSPSISPRILLGTAVGIVVRVLNADVAGQKLTVDLFSSSSSFRSTQSLYSSLG